MKINQFLSLFVVTTVLLNAVNSFSAEAGYITPRTEFGMPDLQGTWSISTQTNLERAQRFNGQLNICLLYTSDAADE